MDRKINLPVTWSVCGIVEIEAPSIEAAIKQFNASIEIFRFRRMGKSMSMDRLS